MFKSILNTASEIGSAAKTYADGYIAKTENPDEPVFSENDFKSYRSKIEVDYREALNKRTQNEKSKYSELLKVEKKKHDLKINELSGAVKLKEEEIDRLNLILEGNKEKLNFSAELEKMFQSSFQTKLLEIKQNIVSQLKTKLEGVEEEEFKIIEQAIIDSEIEFPPESSKNEISARIEALAKENLELHSKISSLEGNQKEFALVSNQYSDLKQEFETKISSLTEESATTKNQVNDLELREKASNKQLAELSAELQKANNSLEQAKNNSNEKAEIFKMALKSVMTTILNDSYIEEIQAVFEDEDKIYENVLRLAEKSEEAVKFKGVAEVLTYLSHLESNLLNSVRKGKFAEIETISREIDSVYSSENEDLVKKLAETKNQLETVTETLNQSKERHQSAMSILKNELNGLKVKLRENDKIIKENENDEEMKLKTIDSLSRESEDLRKKIIEFEGKQSEFEDLKTNFDLKVEEVRSEMRVYKAENSELKDKNRKLKNDLSQRIESEAKLQREIVEFQAEKKEIKEENKNEDLLKKIEDLENLIEAEASIRNENEQKMREKLNQSEKENNRLESELSQCKVKIEEFSQNEEKIKNLSDKIALLEGENESLLKSKKETKKYVAETVNRIREEFASIENQVDRRIVGDLLLKYLSVETPGPIRRTILETLVNVLEINDADRLRLGVSPATAKKKTIDQKVESISDELYKFIVNS